MKSRLWWVVAVLLSASFLVSRQARANAITNGSFQTGNLSGWTVFHTSNGTNGAGLPDVVLFNTGGTAAGDAARFNVGEVSFDSTPQGGGLMQTITVPAAGAYTLTTDFASQDGANRSINVDAGTFAVIIDGTTVASDFLGNFTAPLQVLRGSFDRTVNLPAGRYSFEVEITRRFTSDGAFTPDEYVDDISLTPTGRSATPEPGSLLLMGTGLLGLGTWTGWRLLARSTQRASGAAQ